MSIFKANSVLVFCYGSLSGLVQWIPRWWWNSWSRDHSYGDCVSWNPFKFLQLFFYPSSPVTVFYLLLLLLLFLTGSCFQCWEISTKDWENPGHWAQWMSPISSSALSFMRESALSKFIPKTPVLEGTGLRENCWLRKINWYHELSFPYFLLFLY